MTREQFLERVATARAWCARWAAGGHSDPAEQTIDRLAGWLDRLRDVVEALVLGAKDIAALRLEASDLLFDVHGEQGLPDPVDSPERTPERYPLLRVLRDLTNHERRRLEQLDRRREYLVTRLRTNRPPLGDGQKAWVTAEASALGWVLDQVRAKPEPERVTVTVPRLQVPQALIDQAEAALGISQHHGVIERAPSRLSDDLRRASREEKDLEKREALVIAAEAVEATEVELEAATLAEMPPGEGIGP